MQYLTDPFVVFEFSLMFGGPLLLLVSLIADLLLARRALWRAAVVAFAVANSVVLLLWLATVGANLVSGVGGQAGPLMVAGGSLMLVGLATLPIANVVFFAAYAVARRRRRQMVALSVPPAIPSTRA